MEQDRRFRRLSLALAFAFFLYAISVLVTGALGRGIEHWMIPQTLIMIGFAIYIVLRELDRPRAAIVVGYGFASIAFLFNFGRAAVKLATESPRLPDLAINIALLLIFGVLLAYVVPYARRSYRSASSPPA